MICEIIINVNPHETRIAVMEDNLLVELFAEKKESEFIVGNIYKGIIRNVLPGMGAAFVDIGLSRTAFLHFKDIDPNYLLPEHKKIYNKRDSSLIDRILRPGQEVVVQVKKDPIGKKGARVTGKLSIAGKFLVLMPFQKKIAISKKITSAKEKNRVREILNRLKEENNGLIIRTDTEGISEDDFDVEYTGLSKTWKLIEKQMKYAKGPCCIYDENDLSFTLVRDIFNSSVQRLVVDDKKLKQRIISRLKNVTPELIDRIELYSEDSPIFDAFGIEKEIASIFNSRVNLPNGGNITIEQTEALVAIDINTGSFTGSAHYEDTIEQTNLEAAKEIARQIRLRDLSGIMAIDFIDMKSEESRDKVYNTVKTLMKRDRAKLKVLPINQLGLMEISRKRSRPSLLLSYSEPCPHCKGTGRLLSRDSVAIKISRWLQRAGYFIKTDPLQIAAHKNVIDFIEKNPSFFKGFKNKLEFIVDPSIEPNQFKIIYLKTREDITQTYNI